MPEGGAGPTASQIFRRQRSPLLTYHEISPSQSRDLYRVSAGDFNLHLSLLSRLLDAGLLDRNEFHVSFDDGHLSNSALACPLLHNHGIHALFFVTPAWIGARASAMTWEEVRELTQKGHSVQSHGWSHKLLTGCSPKELHHELAASKAVLEEKLSSPVTALSLPGGRWNGAVLQAAAAAGYQEIFTSDPIFRPVLWGRLRLHGRAMVHRNTSSGDLEKFLTSDRLYWMGARLKWRAKKLLQTGLGDDLYAAIWRGLARRTHPRESFSPDETLQELR